MHICFFSKLGQFSLTLWNYSSYTEIIIMGTYEDDQSNHKKVKEEIVLMIQKYQYYLNFSCFFACLSSYYINFIEVEKKS